ncbi:MAG: HTH domain-containing protein [Rhodocyclaceae bacterium]|nr:HTH domain-containing protein [Rhodocyclaceae bacterium]
MRPHSDTLTTVARLVARLYQGESLTTRKIMRQFDVSRATAKRHMLILETALPVLVEDDPCSAGRPRKIMRLMPGSPNAMAEK